MFFHDDIKADRLPLGTVCLTYDDGPGTTAGDSPGPRTAELGRYLFEEGISATFFAIGRHAEQHPDVVRQLHHWGHAVGNHTHTHPGLMTLMGSGGDPAEDVARADAVLRSCLPGEPRYFRPPYGSWRAKTRPDGPEDALTSPVAAALNRDGRLRHYVGPMKWEIVGEDWHCWRRGLPVEEAARRHVEAVERIGRGILLMHDSSDEPEVRERNQTMQLTRLLVPLLKARGYRFIPLDEIPQVRSAVRVQAQIALRTPAPAFLARQRDTDHICVAGPHDRRDAFGIVPVDGGRIALRASNGLYVSVRADGAVAADAEAPSDSQMWAVDEVGEGRVALRTSRGLYLRCDGSADATVRADASRRGDYALLEMVPLFGP
jgi:peptidoglycan/xylan/chitin deacetylase (PgdA/CDA1 family)